MMWYRALIFAAALCLVLNACALVDGSKSEPDVYEGIYSQGVEDSTFEPCGRSERWLIAAGDTAAVRDFIRRAFDEMQQGHNPMYARLRGTLSSKGSIPGFFVTFDRTLEVTGVLEVRAIQEGDCQ